MNRIVLLMLCLIGNVLNFSVSASDIILENKTLKVVLDNERGTVKQLISKATGWEIQKRQDLALSFFMNIPLEDQIYNPAIGKNQKTVVSKVDKSRQKVTFIWNSLRTEKGGELDIRFTGTIQLKDNGLTFTAEVENNSKYQIETICWPQLGDLSMPDGTVYFSQKGIMYGGMQEMQLFPKYANEPGYFAVDYPMNWQETPYTPFSLFGNGSEGLYVGYHDTTAEDKVRFKTELKPGYESYELWDTGVNPVTDSIGGEPVRLEFTTVHFSFVLPKETKKLKPVVLQPYVGTWHSGAEIYKIWRSQWFKAPYKPSWLKEVNSWQQIHLNNPVDDVRYSYADLYEIGKECAENGVKAIQITGWTIGGQDKGNPSHDIDPRLGSWEEFKDVIAKIQQLGVKVILFTKFTWADRTTSWYKNELINFTTKDPYGEPHYHNGYAYQTDAQLAEINTHHFSPMCHLSKEWRNLAGKEFIKTLDLGADGMLFDENQHHGGASYCFDSTHGHKIPAHIFAGDEVLAEAFNSIKKERNQEYIFAGEGHYDLENRHYLVSYFRADLNHIPMQRFVSPDEEMIIAVSGYNDRNLINTALLYRYIISYEPRNFKGRLNEFPLTLEYGKKIDDFRRMFKNFLWNGEFRHTTGIRVFADNKLHDKYSVFKNNNSGKRGVVIANFDYKQAIEVQIDSKEFKSQLYSASPENMKPSKFTGKGKIPPNSVLFVFER